MAFDKESTFVLGNSMKKLDFSGRVRGMRCPVLIICGEKDRSNIRSAQYLSQNILARNYSLSNIPAML